MRNGYGIKKSDSLRKPFIELSIDVADQIVDRDIKKYGKFNQHIDIGLAFSLLPASNSRLSVADNFSKLFLRQIIFFS